MTTALKSRTLPTIPWRRICNGIIRFFELDFAFRKWTVEQVTVASISSRKFRAANFGGMCAPSSSGRELTAFDIVLDTPAGRTEVVEFDCEHLKAGSVTVAKYRTSRWTEPQIEVKRGSLCRH